MKTKLLLILLLFSLASCGSLFRNTFGKYYINHLYNGGKIISTEFYFEVPYSTENGSIYITIKQSDSDKEYRFLFDTGAYSGVSKTVVDEFNGEYLDIKTATNDINGKRQYHGVYCVDSLYIGDEIINQMNFSIEEYYDKTIDGIIGADFLKGKIFVFKPNEKKIIITNNINLIDLSEYEHFKIKKRWDKMYLLKVKLAKNNTKSFIIDTGSNGFLRLTNDISKIEFSRRKDMKIVVRGAYSQQEREVSYLQIENFHFKSIKIDTATITLSSSYSENLMGSQLFLHEQVILNFIDNKIYFKQNSRISSIGDKVPNEDVILGWVNNRLVIAQVSSDLKEISPQDIVVKINEQIPPLVLDEVKVFIENQKNKGKMIDIVLKRKMDTINVRLLTSQIR